MKKRIKSKRLSGTTERYADRISLIRFPVVSDQESSGAVWDCSVRYLLLLFFFSGREEESITRLSPCSLKNKNPLVQLRNPTRPSELDEEPTGFTGTSTNFIRS